MVYRSPMTDRPADPAQRRKREKPPQPTDAELQRERDMAAEPKQPIGFGAYQHVPVRYDE